LLERFIDKSFVTEELKIETPPCQCQKHTN
jgi:hypothetical protein